MASAIASAVVVYVETIASKPVPEPATIKPRVTVSDGVLIADFPAAFAELADLSQSASGAEVWRRIAVTVMSDPDVTAVNLLLESNCQAFSLATGGDDCPGPVGRLELRGKVIR